MREERYPAIVVYRTEVRIEKVPPPIGGIDKGIRRTIENKEEIERLEESVYGICKRCRGVYQEYTARYDDCGYPVKKWHNIAPHIHQEHRQKFSKMASTPGAEIGRRAGVHYSL
ncbi:MAG: hypothetical protein HZB67_00285 [Candidatus Aenigmarchaeota archaeon]|nr:hypothetical protein [Candidatus Aenigmarchaeota archaeon]